MKSKGMVLALILMAATLLSGCVIVPLGGWHGHGYRHGYGGGGYYQHYGPPYRGR
jgi:5-formyltetrahydrofolate cyclo-ligase